MIWTLSSVQFSRSVMSDSLRPHESQHARPPCPSPTPGVYSNSWSSSRWCHLILCRHLLLLPPIPPMIRVFSNESTLHIRWPKYWEFQLQHQSFQWMFRVGFLLYWLVWYLLISIPEISHSTCTVQLECCMWSENSPFHRRIDWPLPYICMIRQCLLSKPCAMMSDLKAIIFVMVICSKVLLLRSWTAHVQTPAPLTLATRCGKLLKFSLHLNNWKRKQWCQSCCVLQRLN